MLESGQELSARFILVRALGTGGSGAVWLAQDRERGISVAVKILADRLMQDVAGLAALKLECDRVRTLEHPAILPIDALYRSPRHAWIAMEYASGGDLTQLRGRSATEILRATVPIAAALAFAHRGGVVHRDVKPANVLLTANGAPKLTDFGIALATAQLPPGGGSRGSPFSASPQQIDGQAASPADDIYSFGALLYELFSGYPPFYPDASPDRVRTQKPVPLPASVPPAVAELIERCLAKLPAERPADMEAVERALAAALEQLPSPALGEPAKPIRVEPPGIRAPTRQSETLRSEWQKSTGTAASVGADELRRQGFRRGLAVAGVVLTIGAVGIVFFALPKWVAKPETARYAPAASPVPAEAPKVVEPEQDLATLARIKQEAEEARTPLGERVEKLKARAVEQWAADDFRNASDELAAGDKDFAAREYQGALRHFTAVAPLLDVLEKRAGEVLKEQLAAGAKALEEGRSADARTAFELATRLDPKNAVATKGLKRATTLDEVLSLVAAAERAEKDGELTRATDQFRKALALDTDAPRAAAGIARIEARVAGDAFASAMARGFDALSRADYPLARREFEAAGRIRPSAPEVPQALKQIEQEQRTGVITVKLKNAAEFEATERWADALKEYQAILELDTTVASAKAGAERVTPRAALNQELELYVTQPERLFSQPVRAGAKETLARAATIPKPGPVLTRQMVTLKDWFARADIPVQIALQSDNVTQVRINRVGDLGAFQQRSVELAPGSYTVVGTRSGYRDVRREITVVPGAAPAPVVIRCEDKI